MSHDSSPTPKPSADELLSASIDGELSEEERRRVEAYLAEDSAARRLNAEFQAVSKVLRTLPRQSVDAQFQETVMKAVGAAEKRVSASPVSVPVSNWFHRRARGLAWSALAVAAALLVMFFSDEKPRGNRELAKRAEPSVGNDPPIERAKEKTRLEPGAMRAEDDRREMVGSPVLAEEDQTKAPLEVEQLATHQAIGKARDDVKALDVEALDDRAPAPTAGALAEHDPGDRGRRSGPSQPAASRSSVPESAVPAAGKAAEKAAETRELSGGPATERYGGGMGGRSGLGGGSGMGGGGYGRLRGGGYGGMGGLGSRPSGRAAGEKSPAGEPRENRPGVDGAETNLGVARHLFFESQAPDAIRRCIEQGAGAVETQQLVRDLEKFTPQGEPLYVVQADLSPAAVRTQAFDKTLVQNTIRLERQEQDRDAEHDHPLSESLDRLLQLADAPRDQVVAVVVEATPTQLHAILHDLQADVRNCVNLEVQSNTLSQTAMRELGRFGRRQQERVDGTRHGFRRHADEESKRSRDASRGVSEQPVAGDETADGKLAMNQTEKQETDEKSNEKGSGVVVEDHLWEEGADQVLGRAWVVELAPPDRNRAFGYAPADAGGEATRKSDARGPNDPQGIVEPTSKPADAPAVVATVVPDGSGRPLPEPKGRLADRGQLGPPAAVDRARAVFLLRMAPSDGEAANLPAGASESVAPTPP